MSKFAVLLIVVLTALPVTFAAAQTPTPNTDPECPSSIEALTALQVGNAVGYIETWVDENEDCLVFISGEEFTLTSAAGWAIFVLPPYDPVSQAKPQAMLVYDEGLVFQARFVAARYLPMYNSGDSVQSPGRFLGKLKAAGEDVRLVEAPPPATPTPTPTNTPTATPTPLPSATPNPTPFNRGPFGGQ